MHGRVYERSRVLVEREKEREKERGKKKGEERVKKEGESEGGEKKGRKGKKERKEKKERKGKKEGEPEWHLIGQEWVQVFPCDLKNISKMKKEAELKVQRH